MDDRTFNLMALFICTLGGAVILAFHIREFKSISSKLRLIHLPGIVLISFMLLIFVGIGFTLKVPYFGLLLIPGLIFGWKLHAPISARFRMLTGRSGTSSLARQGEMSPEATEEVPPSRLT